MSVIDAILVLSQYPKKYEIKSFIMWLVGFFSVCLTFQENNLCYQQLVGSRRLHHHCRYSKWQRSNKTCCKLKTTVVWDKETGKPLCNAIVWLDTRTADLAAEAITKTASKSQNEFKKKTGLPIHPYFSALKLKWLLNNVEEVREAHTRGTLLFGTVDTWLIWNLTGEHVTDVSNASRTLLLDLHKRKWSTELCTFFELPQDILPEIRSSAEVYGYFRSGPLVGVPIAGCLGDQQAAMVGHNCLQRGDTKNTYGTGTFMLCNIGTKPTISKNGLLTTVGFQFGPDSPVVYALEGSGSIGGNVVRFLRDNFQFIKNGKQQFNKYGIQDAKEMEEICRSVSNTEGVYFVPSFTGLYTPYWDPTARGTILGLTQVSSRAHVCLAALRAVAYQSAEMIAAVEHDLDNEKIITTLKVDGGMTSNGLFNEIQAEIIGKTIKVYNITIPYSYYLSDTFYIILIHFVLGLNYVFQTPKITEISGWGAAVAAGIGAQQISLSEFSTKESPVSALAIVYYPKFAEEQRTADLSRWKEAVKRACGWVNN
uniref:glycerol kinase n=1 Tax=Heterorhabditis bacteriophora TaxID=37862 RepID=A0A1I7XUH2_HETBA